MIWNQSCFGFLFKRRILKRKWNQGELCEFWKTWPGHACLFEAKLYRKTSSKINVFHFIIFCGWFQNQWKRRENPLFVKQHFTNQRYWSRLPDCGFVRCSCSLHVSLIIRLKYYLFNSSLLSLSWTNMVIKRSWTRICIWNQSSNVKHFTDYCIVFSSVWHALNKCSFSCILRICIAQVFMTFSSWHQNLWRRGSQ